MEPAGSPNCPPNAFYCSRDDQYRNVQKYRASRRLINRSVKIRSLCLGTESPTAPPARCTPRRACVVASAQWARHLGSRLTDWMYVVPQGHSCRAGERGAPHLSKSARPSNEALAVSVSAPVVPSRRLRSRPRSRSRRFCSCNRTPDMAQSHVCIVGSHRTRRCSVLPRCASVSGRVQRVISAHVDWRKLLEPRRGCS